jgi:hypothetical protein
VGRHSCHAGRGVAELEVPLADTRRDCTSRTRAGRTRQENLRRGAITPLALIQARYCTSSQRLRCCSGSGPPERTRERDPASEAVSRPDTLAPRSNATSRSTACGPSRSRKSCQPPHSLHLGCCLCSPQRRSGLLSRRSFCSERLCTCSLERSDRGGTRIRDSNSTTSEPGELDQLQESRAPLIMIVMSAEAPGALL